MQHINPKLKSFYQCPSCDSWRTLFTQEGSKWSWWCIDCDRRTSIEAMYRHKFRCIPVYTELQPSTDETNRKLMIDRTVLRLLREWELSKEE